MNAKDLIEKQSLTEAGEPPQPGNTRPPRRPPGGGRPPGFGGPPEGEEFEGGMPGGPGRTSMRPRGPFSPQEMSMIKDVLLLIATEMMGNDFDGKIARKMMKGETPDLGDLQHIVDEARRIRDIPEPYQKLLQKVVGHINSANNPEKPRADIGGD